MTNPSLSGRGAALKDTGGVPRLVLDDEAMAEAGFGLASDADPA